MKKICLVSLLTALMALGLAVGACAETGEEPAEWTVLFYFCGSDLESNYSYATGNLNEINSVTYPENYLPEIAGMYGVDIGEITRPGKVNILIGTGGAEEWHTQDPEMGLDMTVDPRALQYWRYDYDPVDLKADGSRNGRFELMETLPLRSMADPQTLTDFIRWGERTCPAKKYALVLWGHGGGARTGLFTDELFDNDLMYLFELKDALTGAGVRMEAVVIDACLMANLETAWSMKDGAHWMVASEETVPGKGTAIGSWLQQLVDYPECDGEWLGRTICDMNLIKYVNEAGTQSRSTLTWSVIDLSKIDSLIDAFGRFFGAMNDAIRHYPKVAGLYARLILESEEYGDGQENMRDLAGVACNTRLATFMDHAMRCDLLNALSEAVTYSVRGTGRSGARGLSFCYSTDFSPEELETYSKNFPQPEYLAYLDAITDWKAPGWVFEKVEPLPDIDSLEDFRLLVVRRMTDSGMPALDMTQSLDIIDNVYYRLYKLDEETGDVLRLGRSGCAEVSWNQGLNTLFRAKDPVHWPSVDGVLFCMDLIQSQYDQRLYNIPVQINSQNSILRCGRFIRHSSEDTYDLNDYEIYGLWEGFEENSALFDRSVTSLSELVGQEYCFLYPVDGDGGDAGYQSSQMMTMYRALDVQEIPLPEGTYYIEYEVDDMFLRSYLLDRIEFHWDGKNMTFPEGFAWEGEVVLNATDENRKGGE